MVWVHSVRVLTTQGGKKVVSDSPGLVHFTIRLVNSVVNLPDGQVKSFGVLKLQKNCNLLILLTHFCFGGRGLVEMTFGLEGGIGGLSTPKGHKKKITNTASLQKKADKPPTPQFDFCSPIFKCSKKVLGKGTTFCT